MAGGFNDPLLGIKINIYQAKPWIKSFCPFKIIRETPYKITFDINAVIFCPEHLGKIIFNKTHSLKIIYFSIVQGIKKEPHHFP